MSVVDFGIDPSLAAEPTALDPLDDATGAQPVRWLRPVIAAMVAVLLTTGAAAWYLSGAIGMGQLLGRSSTVTIGISLTPDATGTKVEVVAEDPTGSLPATVDVDLTRADGAKLPAGASSTGLDLTYSDVEDGFGYLLPADQVRAAKLVQVHTDGRRLKLNFHVGVVDRHRIIYPVPKIDGVDWSGVRVYTQASLTCWGSPRDGGTTATYTPCGNAGSGLIEGSRYSTVRLELAP